MLIAHLRIQLTDVTPPPVRVVEVPVDITLARLHLVVQAAMPWLNYHLYEFRTRKERWGLPMEDFGFPMGVKSHNANKGSLAELLASQKSKTFDYVYDFGDDWLHKVKVERLFEAEDGVVYPRLVDASGACPPEDCGGPWGYAEMVEALEDPDHDRHEEITEWLGEDFDPNHFDKAALTTAVAKLARKGKAKSPAKRKRVA